MLSWKEDVVLLQLLVALLDALEHPVEVLRERADLVALSGGYTIR